MKSACERECLSEQNSLVNCMKMLQRDRDSTCLPDTLNSWIVCCSNANSKDENISIKENKGNDWNSKQEPDDMKIAHMFIW